MKRKHLEDVDDDFSFAPFSAKSRRLDAELFPRTAVEFPTTALPAFEQHPEHPPSPGLTQSDEEKAIVLYNPSNGKSTFPFLRSPATPEFSVIFKSDMIPALKDYLHWSENSHRPVIAEEETAGDESTRESDDRLAVVPWVAQQHYLSSGTEGVAMEAENMEVDMMDTEDNQPAVHYEEMMEGAERLQQWQQHCMAPQLPQNISTPVTW